MAAELGIAARGIELRLERVQDGEHTLPGREELFWRERVRDHGLDVEDGD